MPLILVGWQLRDNLGVVSPGGECSALPLEVVGGTKTKLKNSAKTAQKQTSENTPAGTMERETTYTKPEL